MALAAGLWLALVVPVQAATDAVDQSQQSASASNSLTTTPMAQTFVAGATGLIDKVSLMIATVGTTASNGPVTANVQIRSVSGGKPTATVLGTSAFNGSVACCRKWHDFLFSAGAPVTTGTQYAIVVVPLSGTFVWYDSFTVDAYAAGQLWAASGSDWVYLPATYGNDFCFQTFVVAGAANQPPVVGADSAAVTVNEGSPASNTGTYSDPDGDAVTLTASSGSVTGSAGVWTWSAPAADESPLQTVTITATDPSGATATVAFTVTVVAVAPTVTITGAPATAPEGTSLTLTGKVSSPSSEDTTAGFTLAWTVTKDGLPFATGSGASLTMTPDDEGAFVATLQAVDDGANATTSTVAFSGANVAPKAVITSITHATLILVAKQPATFNASFTDPGALDTHTGTLTFGDGSAPAVTAYAAGGSGTVTADHAYAKPGTYTVTYTVTDDDAGISAVTSTVTVDTIAQALAAIEAYVQKITSLSTEQKRELSDRLKEAIKQAGRGGDQENHDVCRSVDSFISDVADLTKTKKLSAADSAELSSAAWSVHRALGCRKIRMHGLNLDL